jgi:hypothetical protein
VDIEQEKETLRKLCERGLQAHLEYNAEKMLASSAQQWYDLRDGTVILRTKDEMLPEVEQYLKNTHFLEYEEVTPPIIQVSKDASMAWIISEIRVRALQKQPDGAESDLAFRCSWVSVFEKQEGGWAQVVNASTFQE